MQAERAELLPQVCGEEVVAVDVGGARGDLEAHPEGMVVDARRRLLYVAVTNRDLVAVIDVAMPNAGRTMM